MLTLRVKDETVTGQLLTELELRLEGELLTVRELVRAWVHQDVREHHAAEGAALRLDPDRETERAVASFELGRIMLVVDGRRVDGIEEELMLAPACEVTFLRLVPLAGG